MKTKTKAKAKAKAKAKSKPKSKRASGSKPAPKPRGKVKLLSGGNPQIPKGYGEAPVRAYLSAIPGWKRALGRRLDALIMRAVPDATKAVKWNSPFYGIPDGGIADAGWFTSFHCFDKYIKVTFFRGSSLHPQPPGASKHPEVRYLDIHEDRELDEAQLIDWMKQASKLPGEKL
jgi:hypothetical protein